MTTEIIEQPKSVMINPNYTKRRNRDRIEQDEKELEELMGKEPEEQEEDEAQTPEEDSSEETPSSKEEQTFKKRYGDLRRFVAQKEKEWEEKLEQAKEAKGGFAPPKSNEDLEAWAKKYPDVAGIVESIAARKAQEMFEKTSNRFKELDELTYETKRSKAETSIREVHPDFDTLKNSDGFHDWAEEQPKWITDALYDNQDDARAVIRVIDLYKVDKGMTPVAKKAKAKDAAPDVSAKQSSPKLDPDGSSTRIKESDVVKMSDKEFEKNYDKIMEAQAKGTFVYDITKR